MWYMVITTMKQNRNIYCPRDKFAVISKAAHKSNRSFSNYVITVAYDQALKETKVE